MTSSTPGGHPTPPPPDDPLDADLFPQGIPTDEKQIDRMFELYKIMVTSSEALVGRRQGVNTFFLTINGALLTAAGLVLSNGNDTRVQAGGLLVLTITGGILAGAWRSLLLSFGQLNTGKFAVINRIERLLPVAIYDRVEGTQEGRGSQDLPHLQFQGGVATNDLLLVYVVATSVGVIVLLRG